MIDLDRTAFSNFLRRTLQDLADGNNPVNNPEPPNRQGNNPVNPELVPPSHHGKNPINNPELPNRHGNNPGKDPLPNVEDIFCKAKGPIIGTQ